MRGKVWRLLFGAPRRSGRTLRRLVGAGAVFVSCKHGRTVDEGCPDCMHEVRTMTTLRLPATFRMSPEDVRQALGHWLTVYRLPRGMPRVTTRMTVATFSDGSAVVTLDDPTRPQ